MDIKNRKVLGVPAIIVIVLTLITAGIASAALLGVFESSQGNVEVKQAVTWADEEPEPWGVEIYGGGSASEIFSVETHSESAAPIELVSWAEADTTNSDGLTVSNSLVTTAFSKDSGSVSWNSDGTVDLREYSGAGTAVVMVPVEEGINDASELEDLVNNMDLDSTGDVEKQLMIDLNPSNADSNWAQASADGFFVYSSEDEFVETFGDLGNVDSEYLSDAVIVGAKANLYDWQGDGNDSLSGTVDSMTFNGTTYDLIKDDRHELVTDEFTMPPLPEEEFDFKVTVEAAIDLEPDNFTIYTNVKPFQ